jgi:hypothetical protein
VEDDFRSLNRLPELSGSDFSSRVRIRNGGVDEQLYTLDEVELLEPHHLKDFDGALSSLDGEVIGGITVTTGGFGAAKGNRMAGLVEMTCATPASARARSAIGLSLSNIRARSDGTFASDRGGWLLSARRGYLDLVLKLTGEEDPPSPRCGDVFGKVFYQLSDAHQLAVHALVGSNNLTLRDTDGSRITSKYGNNYLWSMLRSRAKDRATAVTLVPMSRLTWQRDLLETQGVNGVRVVRAHGDDRRLLDAYTAKQDRTANISPAVSLAFGGEFRSEDADYRYAREQRQRAVVNRTTGVVDSLSVHAALAPNGTRTSGYATLRLRPTSAFTLEGGGRADHHSWTQQTTASPRANTAWTVRPGTTLRGAWGFYHQAHALQNVDGPTTSPLPEAELDRVRIAPSFARVHGVEMLAQFDRGGRIRAGASLTVSRATAVVDGAVLRRPFDEPYAATGISPIAHDRGGRLPCRGPRAPAGRSGRPSSPWTRLRRVGTHQNGSRPEHCSTAG